MIGEILQCHIDSGDPESFVIGRLVYFDRDWILMQDLSPAGRWNGLALYMRSDIVAVNQFTKYIQRILTLVECRNEREPIVPFLSDNPLISLLHYAKNSKRIVGLELHASGYRDVNGTIDKLVHNTLYMNQIDEFGHADGKTYLSVDAITRCFLDDEESTCLEILIE